MITLTYLCPHCDKATRVEVALATVSDQDVMVAARADMEAAGDDFGSIMVKAVAASLNGEALGGQAAQHGQGRRGRAQDLQTLHARRRAGEGLR